MRFALQLACAISPREDESVYNYSYYRCRTRRHQSGPHGYGSSASIATVARNRRASFLASFALKWANIGRNRSRKWTQNSTALRKASEGLYFVMRLAFTLYLFQSALFAAQGYHFADINTHVAKYEYVDPNGDSREIDEIAETVFMERFIKNKYSPYETDIDKNVSDGKGNYLSIACEEGKLYTPNVVWESTRIGQWKTTVLVNRRCFQNWYRWNKRMNGWEFRYRKKLVSSTVRAPFTFTLRFKACRSGEIAFSHKNCTANTGYDRKIR